MNSTVAKMGSGFTAVSVIAFALCMLFRFDFGYYLAGMFIAFGFVVMIAGFHAESAKEHQAAANTALIFAGVYAVLVLLVYYAQTTAVRLDPLGEGALSIIDFKRFGLFFSYDQLGYAVMSLATFFIGLTIDAKSLADKWLKGLLLVHGVFFIVSFVVPMLGLFRPDAPGSAWVGTLILEAWCIYFLPVCILSYLHFDKRRDM